MNLVIIESPNKVKKLSSILGDGYQVCSSVGHVSDLPKNGMGVEPPNFKPTYEVSSDKKSIVSNIISKAKKASCVYVATDPDREGEAIAYHIANLIKHNDVRRVSFNEITKSAVEEAFKTPGSINMDTVRSQESRRVIDRIVGYKVSPVLSKKAGRNLSGGRVQSAALRAVVDRYRQNKGFNSVFHYSVRAKFDGGKWFADLKVEQLEQKDVAESYLKDKSFTVIEYDQSKSKAKPKPPLITSTMQQAASTELKLSVKASMSAAQKLFELGLITYHRTDNPNLSDEFIEQIRTWATNEGYPIPDSPHKWKLPEDAQQGHEAIRVTSLETTSAKTGDSNADKLYSLIYKRTIACQLDFCVSLKTKITLEQQGTKQTFIATASEVVSPGFNTFLKSGDDKKENEQNELPCLNQGSEISSDELELRTLKTKPPALFTEASLVKFLDKEGIGRPSTFASIISTISDRGYVMTEKQKLVPTDLGCQVCDSLVPHFKFMDLQYTKQMEKLLDDVEKGTEKYLPLVSRVWNEIDEQIKGFADAKTLFSIEPCPECGEALKTIPAKKGKYSSFKVCDGCGHKIFESKPKKQLKPVKNCPSCEGGKLVKRNGKNGTFLGCNAYPNCKHSENS